MRIIIEKASVDSFWYANHIGEVFNAEFCNDFDYFEFEINDEKGTRWIVYGDAKIL